MKIIILKKDNDNNNVLKGYFKNTIIEITKLGRKNYQVSVRDLEDKRMILTYCEKTRKITLKLLKEYFQSDFRIKKE